MLIGIDLGTTNSLVACFRNGRAELIPNRLGSVLTPSVRRHNLILFIIPILIKQTNKQLLHCHL